MTVDEIQQRIETILQESHDDEVAHSLEDDLYRDVVRAIAAGAPNARDLAQEALHTEIISFARWCA